MLETPIARPETIDRHDASKAQQKMQILIKPWAMEIMQLLDLAASATDHPLITVNEIRFALKAEQSEISFHLSQMRKVGLVTAVKDGKEVYYSINYQEVEKINRVAKSLAKMYKL